MDELKNKYTYDYYNWQFLRRNIKYREEYDTYASLLVTDKEKAEVMFFGLHSNWGLSSYLDWREELPEHPFQLFFEPITNYGLMSYNELTNTENPPTFDLINIRAGNKLRQRFVLAAFDLEQLRKHQYEDFYKNVIQFLQKRDNLLDVKERITSDVKRLDIVLATYDTYALDKTASHHAIAAKLKDIYLTGQNSNPSEHSQTVKNNIKLALELIEMAPNIPFVFDDESESK